MSAQEAPQWIARATVASTACWAAVSGGGAGGGGERRRESFGPCPSTVTEGDDDAWQHVLTGIIG